MTDEISPMGILVIAELERLRWAEASLQRALSTLSRDRHDEVSEWRILSSMADVRHRTNRLERTLDAMAGCGYKEDSNPAVEMVTSGMRGTTAA